MKLLLVEDERRMREALAELLRQEHYDVDVCADGEEGLSCIQSRIYDAAILDVMLPKLSGFELARIARGNQVKTPILMLTAKSEIDDKVTGLDCGADDYLTKPFVTRELLARIRALCRRNIATDSMRLKAGALELDPDTLMLRNTNTAREVRLSDKEYRILEYLISNYGKILTREAIALKIWGYEAEAEYNNVEVYLSFTRRKLAFLQVNMEIKAVRGAGYLLREKEASDV